MRQGGGRGKVHSGPGGCAAGLPLQVLEDAHLVCKVAACLQAPGLLSLARTCSRVHKNVQVVLHLAALEYSCQAPCLSTGSRDGLRDATPDDDRGLRRVASLVARAAEAQRLHVHSPAAHQALTMQRLFSLLGVFRGVAELQLSHLDITLAEITRVAALVGGLSNLTTVSFQGTTIGCLGATALCPELQKLTQLQRADFSNTGLCNSGLHALQPAFLSMRALTALALAKNRLTSDAAPTLASIFTGNTSPGLRALDIGHNPLTHPAAVSLPQSLLDALAALTMLTQLHMAHSNTRMWEPLCAAISNHSLLQDLDLSPSDAQQLLDTGHNADSQPGDPGLGSPCTHTSHPLLACLANFPHLTRLTLASKHSLACIRNDTSAPTKQLRAAVRQLRELRALHWPVIHLTREHRAWCDALASLRHLTALQYEYRRPFCFESPHHHHGTFTTALDAVLRACEHLRVVQLRLPGTAKLPWALCELSALQSLDVLWHGMEVPECAAVIEALHTLTALQLPRLTWCPVALASALTSLCNLRTLTIPRLCLFGQLEVAQYSAAFRCMRALRKLAVTLVLLRPLTLPSGQSWLCIPPTIQELDVTVHYWRPDTKPPGATALEPQNPFAGWLRANWQPQVIQAMLQPLLALRRLAIELDTSGRDIDFFNLLLLGVELPRLTELDIRHRGNRMTDAPGIEPAAQRNPPLMQRDCGGLASLPASLAAPQRSVVAPTGVLTPARCNEACVHAAREGAWNRGSVEGGEGRRPDLLAAQDPPRGSVLPQLLKLCIHKASASVLCGPGCHCFWLTKLELRGLCPTQAEPDCLESFAQCLQQLTMLRHVRLPSVCVADPAQLQPVAEAVAGLQALTALEVWPNEAWDREEPCKWNTHWQGLACAAMRLPALRIVVVPMDDVLVVQQQLQQRSCIRVVSYESTLGRDCVACH